ncbi:MAG TPA: hypothetical protein VIA18_07505 [Polyangia bacterium]|nr:hypothetical protein [Polyangia bacterium]
MVGPGGGGGSGAFDLGNAGGGAAAGGGGAGGGGAAGGGGVGTGGGGGVGTGGSCSPACAAGQLCINGTCGCPTYQALCNGQCIPVATDPMHCGDCTTVCTGATACSGGKCESSCMAGLDMCSNACVDLQSDNGNCGTCGTACATGQGCVAGTCKTAAPLGPPPAKCVNGGPPITIPVGGGGTQCSGNVAQTTFTWALCSCAGVNASQQFLTDAYDSSQGPYMPGGVGGGVGLDGDWTSSQTVDVGGTLWTSANKGLVGSSPMTVRRELHAGASVTVDMCTIDDDAFISGNETGPMSVGKTLYQSPGATHSSGVTAASGIVAKAVTVPPPCDCSASALLPIAATVAAKKTANDDALIGLDPGLLVSGSPPQRLDLPCGEYYLTGIASPIAVTIAAHGHTALYVDGDITTSSQLAITLDPTATLDLFVSGTIKASQTLAIGSPNYPALSRTYVGSSTELVVSSNVRLATNLYDATALVTWSAPIEVYGSIFAGDFKASSTVKIHYDTAILTDGQQCPPTPPGGCSTCTDCNNQACVNGTCGACTDSSQCCAPLQCINGTCANPIS